MVYVNTKYIAIENLTKTFGSLHILSNVSIQIPKGAVVALVGKTGVGKTTLLRILAGLESYESGTIYIDEVPHRTYLKNKRIGFVFQRPVLFPWFNLKENLRVPLDIKTSYSEEEKEERCKKLLAMFNLQDFGDYYPETLSGGMQQRATVARAMITNPDLLLLDEAFSALDEDTREQLWFEFRKIWEHSDLTTIFVTHSIREAIHLADHIYVFSKSKKTLLPSFLVNLSKKDFFGISSLPEYNELYTQIRSLIK